MKNCTFTLPIVNVYSGFLNYSNLCSVEHGTMNSIQEEGKNNAIVLIVQKFSILKPCSGIAEVLEYDLRFQSTRFTSLVFRYPSFSNFNFLAISHSSDGYLSGWLGISQAVRNPLFQLV